MQITDEIQSKLRILNILRPTLATVLLGSILIFSVLELGKFQANILLSLIIVSFLFSAVYTALKGKVKNLYTLVYVELFTDIIYITVIIFCTGGSESSFQLCYSLTIISGSMFLYKNGAFIISSTACVLYTSLVSMQVQGILKPIPDAMFSGVTSNIHSTIFKVFINVIGLNIIAYLSGSLATHYRASKNELIQTEEDLTRLQTFNTNILQNMSSGLIVTDLNTRIILANQSAASITGFDINSFKNKVFSSVFNSVPLTQILKKLNTNRTSFRWEGNIIHNSGKKVYVGMTVSLLRNNLSEAIGSISTFQNLTELKKMEDEVKRSEKVSAIGELAAGMAHEIRNPLASIRGSVQMLNDELDLDKSSRKLMMIVLEESDRLNKIITDFLAFARPKPINSSKCSIQEVVKDTLALVNVIPETTGKITFKSEIPTNLPLLSFDKDQIKQVLWNLITNSIQAMPDGGIIRVMLSSVDKSSNTKNNRSSIEQVEYPAIKLSVSDQGNCISEESLNKIFDPFYTTKINGSGLGLSIVHRIVENHNGQLSVESKTGEGTTFNIYLPI